MDVTLDICALGENPRHLVLPLIDPDHRGSAPSVSLPQDALHIPGKSPAPVVAFDVALRRPGVVEHLRHGQLGGFHGLVAVHHVHHIPLALQPRRGHGAQVVRARVRRVHISHHRRGAFRQRFVQAEPFVQPSLGVDGHVLVIGLEDIRAGQALLFLPAVKGQQGRAKHGPRAFIQARLVIQHVPLPRLRVQHPAHQIPSVPSGHDDHHAPAFLHPGEQRIGVILPLLRKDVVVVRFQVVLDGVVDNQLPAPHAGNGAAHARTQEGKIAALQAPQLRRRVPVLDAHAGENIGKNGVVRVDLRGVDAVPHALGETARQQLVVGYVDDPVLGVAPEAPLVEQRHGVALPVPRRL